MNTESRAAVAARSGATVAPVLEISGLTRTYTGPPPVDAIAGIDLSIAAGEMLAVVGPSGSGKSTLLNVIGTLDRPTSGTLIVEGIDTARLNDRQLAGLRSARIGFVFQAFHLLETLTALDNVALGLLYRGETLSERRQQAEGALARVGLDHKISARPTELSGGERQRVAIARAIVAEPALVLADEPTGNLDSATAQSLIELLHELNGGGATIVVITHDHEVAATMPRIVTMRDGLIESDNRSAARPTNSTGLGQ